MPITTTLTNKVMAKIIPMIVAVLGIAFSDISVSKIVIWNCTLK